MISSCEEALGGKVVERAGAAAQRRMVFVRFALGRLGRPFIALSAHLLGMCHWHGSRRSLAAGPKPCPLAVSARVSHC